MRMFFGKVEDNSDLSGTFEVQTADGVENYYTMVEYGTNAGGLDEFVISDACGRYVPLVVEDIETLQNILADLSEIVEQVQDANDIIEQVTDEDELYIY